MMNCRLWLNLLCCLLCAVTSFTYANSSKLAFKQYQITAPFNVRLPVIAVDIINNEQYPADELVIIGEDEANKMWAAVYVFDEKKHDFVLFDKLLLANKYFAFDVSEDQQGLYFLAKTEVVMLSYQDKLNKNDTIKPKLYLEHKQQINSIFLVDNSSFITKKDFIQDVNNDGLDDIILPDFEQVNLWLQLPNSATYTYQALLILPHTQLIKGSVNFEPTRLFFVDLTLDGRQDVAWVSEGTLYYFRQTEKGLYAAQRESHALVDTIKGLDWWQIRESDGESLDQSNLIHRVVDKIQDINSDGLVDIVVKFTKSSGVLDRINDYEFYFGKHNENNQLAFSKTPNTVIQADGTLTGLNIIDVNNDDKFEVLLSSFELSVSNIIGALLSGGIDQNVLLFALNDQGVYEEDAIINKEVELSFSLTSGQSGQPIVLLADVNGDNLQDFILSSGEEKLKIFLGKNNSKLFEKRSTQHKITLPKNGALFDHHDLNNDGKEDFLMSYSRLDDEEMANKVTILIVK